MQTISSCDCEARCAAIGLLSTLWKESSALLVEFLSKYQLLGTVKLSCLLSFQGLIFQQLTEKNAFLVMCVTACAMKTNLAEQHCAFATQLLERQSF